MIVKERDNIVWVDLLRIIACFLVVLSHCCDPFVAHFNSDYSKFLQGCGMGSAVRCCVPLFVMMSGVLLLPVKTTMGEFYGKRFKRLLVPLIFWSLALPVIYYLYFLLVGATSSPSVDMSMYSADMTIRKLSTFIFNFNYDTTPLWYLYMLAGLYLVIPIFSSWLQNATQKEMKLFLKIWLFTLFIPYIKMFAPLLGYMGNYGHMGLFGDCDWNSYSSFYYVSGFIGYIVLAHYLVKYPLNWSWQKLALVGIPMWLAGYAITFGGFVMMNEQFPGNYAYLEILWWFCGINVFLMTFPIFVAIQKVKIKSSPRLSKLASMTFGIYLCHFVFVQMGYDLYLNILPDAVPAFVRIILNAVTVFVVCYGLVRLFSLNRFTRRLVA